MGLESSPIILRTHCTIRASHGESIAYTRLSECVSDWSERDFILVDQLEICGSHDSDNQVQEEKDTNHHTHDMWPKRSL